MSGPWMWHNRMTHCYRVRNGHARLSMNPMAGKKTRDHACDQALHSGAGDENRTRTISLGSSAVAAARGADQASLAVPSDPG